MKNIIHSMIYNNNYELLYIDKLINNKPFFRKIIYNYNNYNNNNVEYNIAKILYHKPQDNIITPFSVNFGTLFYYKKVFI